MGRNDRRQRLLEEVQPFLAPSEEVEAACWANVLPRWGGQKWLVYLTNQRLLLLRPSLSDPKVGWEIAAADPRTGIRAGILRRGLLLTRASISRSGGPPLHLYFTPGERRTGEALWRTLGGTAQLIKIPVRVFVGLGLVVASGIGLVAGINVSAKLFWATFLLVGLVMLILPLLRRRTAARASAQPRR